MVHEDNDKCRASIGAGKWLAQRARNFPALAPSDGELFCDAAARCRPELQRRELRPIGAYQSLDESLCWILWRKGAGSKDHLHRMMEDSGLRDY
jgi:hypothetical protein